MKKRLVTLLLVLSMTGTMVTGCGAGGKGESTSKDSGKEVLTFMAVGGSAEQAFTDVIEAAAEDFNNSNEYNVEIKLEWYENEQYKTKLATLMTQDDVTDIFFTWEAGFMEDYVNSGKVASLSEALESDEEWMGRFNDGAFDAVTYDNEIYAVPMGQAIIPVYYNKQIFADNEVEIPVTWEEFTAAIQTFKDAGVTPIAMGSQDAWVAGQMMLELSGGVGGKALFDDIVNGETAWDDERYVETGKTFQELVDLGAFQEGFLGISGDEARMTFTEGNAAMYPMGTWDTATVISGFGGSENVGVFLMPAKYAENNDTRIKTIEKLFAVSEKSENKEAAFAFLKTLSDPEVQENYVITCGALPATNVQIDESAIDPVTADIMTLQQEVKNALTPMDRQFGANVGGEFNNISAAIAGGADAAEQFAALQAYAEQEAAQ